MLNWITLANLRFLGVLGKLMEGKNGCTTMRLGCSDPQTDSAIRTGGASMFHTRLKLSTMIRHKKQHLYVAEVCDHGMVIEVASPEGMRAVARRLLDTCQDQRIFAIYGDLGAGKTTLVKALCAELGTEDVVKSPTFAIVNVYHAPQDEVYHFDFYRIRDLVEVFDLGYEEYFDSGKYCFIEWPEMIAPLLPDAAAAVHITVTGAFSRSLTLRCTQGT
jgi:tRNA threonylcarbamoyladenosine biosynthesis protein TsaE